MIAIEAGWSKRKTHEWFKWSDFYNSWL